jgi:hypothetical protein
MCWSTSKRSADMKGIAVAVEAAGNGLAVYVLVRHLIPAAWKARLPELNLMWMVLTVWFTTNVLYAAMYANRHLGFPPDPISYDHETFDNTVELVQQTTMWSLPVAMIVGSYFLFAVRGAPNND